MGRRGVSLDRGNLFYADLVDSLALHSKNVYVALVGRAQPRSGMGRYVHCRLAQEQHTVNVDARCAALRASEADIPASRAGGQ